MDQHFVPESYLRQWCAEDDGKLVEYRRIGPPGAPQLRSKRKLPKGICKRENINTLPKGGFANGMTGDQIEHLLGKNVDQEIPLIVARVGDRSGPLEPDLGNQVKWLMQTFVARAPSMLAELELAGDAFRAEHESLICRELAREGLPPMIKDAFLQFLDQRLPAVAARAGLAGIAANKFVPMRGWYEGTVHVLQAEKVWTMLNDLGLSDFPTFDEPVVHWKVNSTGLVATFSLSPNALSLVIKGSSESAWAHARRHIVSALRARQSAILLTEATDGPWLLEAQTLVPWEQPE